MAKKLSPLEQKSSKTVLDALRNETKGLMKGKMDGLKKVSVASNSPEGLKKGLDLAKKVLPGNEEAGEPADLLDEGSEDAEELAESPEMEASEQADGSEVEGLTAEEEAMSPEEIDHLISKLLELKAKKQ
jgi:hypothetical protein